MSKTICDVLSGKNVDLLNERRCRFHYVPHQILFVYDRDILLDVLLYNDKYIVLPYHPFVKTPLYNFSDLDKLFTIDWFVRIHNGA